MPLVDFHRLPGDLPEVETMLRPGELVTAIELAPGAAAANSAYRKVRDRSSYAFALISVAAGIEVVDGEIKDVRIALGGVAAKPWRAVQAEAFLRGRSPSRGNFLEAAYTELATATPYEGNAFKIELAKRTIAAVLGELTGAHA